MGKFLETGVKRMDILEKEVYNIRQVLVFQAKIFKRMLNIMDKPENKAVKVLHIVVLVVGAMGLLNFIDLIIKWIIGE